LPGANTPAYYEKSFMKRSLGVKNEGKENSIFSFFQSSAICLTLLKILT
jgi:hypothetical protein